MQLTRSLLLGALAITATGCPAGPEILATAASNGVCYMSSSSFNVLCALNVGVSVPAADSISTGDLTIVTTSLVMNTYHVGPGWSGYLSTDNVVNTTSECGGYDARLQGNGCPLIHNGVACVSNQTTLDVFDGGPDGALLASVDIDVPFTCQ
jgi:hypothetical protein